MSDQIPTPPPPPEPTPYGAQVATPKQSLSLTSFILGLAGLLFSWIPFVGVLGFLASVGAVVTGFLGRAKEPQAPKWMWLIGIIAGFVAIGISIIFLIVFIVAIITLGSQIDYNNLPGNVPRPR
jgi:nucleoside recognition membrane protein YjiH